MSMRRKKSSLSKIKTMEQLEFDKEKEDPTEHEGKGMSSKALAKSRAIRKRLLLKWGGEVPTSILLHDRGETQRLTKGQATLKDSSVDGRGGGYVHHFKDNKSKMLSDKNYIPNIEKSGLSIQGRKNYLSSFPQKVGNTMIEFYCPKDGLILDLFAGHNSRMELCFNAERDYIGIDVCKEFHKDNVKIRDILLSKQPRLECYRTPSITLINASSHKVDLPSNHADFTITSPPYWDLEYYGDEPEQLGNAKTYDSFLDLITVHVKENLRILKPGSFCCWFVNDFRKNKKFYAYHVDLYDIFCDVGFEPFNIYIVDLGHAVQATFAQVIDQTKILPKRHEYILVFKKPEEL